MSFVLARLRRAIVADKVRAAHVAFHAVFLSTLIALIYRSRFGAAVQVADGAPFVSPDVELRCLDKAWTRSGYNCGLNGQDCRPFETRAWTTFVCGPSCTQKGTPWEVVIGGLHGRYHPASRLCMAAAHAGVTTLGRGGCAAYRLSGPVASFGSGSHQNGVTSVDFTYSFPRR